MNFSYQLDEFVKIVNYARVLRNNEKFNDKDAIIKDYEKNHKSTDLLFKSITISVSVIAFLVYAFIIYNINDYDYFFLQAIIFFVILLFLYTIFLDIALNFKLFDTKAGYKKYILDYIIYRLSSSNTNFDMKVIDNLIQEMKSSIFFPDKKHNYVFWGSILVITGPFFNENNIIVKNFGQLSYYDFGFSINPKLLAIVIIIISGIILYFYLTFYFNKKTLIITNYYAVSVKNYLLEGKKIK